MVSMYALMVQSSSAIDAPRSSLMVFRAVVTTVRSSPHHQRGHRGEDEGPALSRVHVFASVRSSRSLVGTGRAAEINRGGRQ